MPATKTKKRRPEPEAESWDDAPLPIGFENAMSTKMVRNAIARISATQFRKMLATGEFPRPDWKLGRLSMWNRSTVEGWIKARKAQEAAHGMGK